MEETIPLAGGRIPNGYGEKEGIGVTAGESVGAIGVAVVFGMGNVGYRESELFCTWLISVGIPFVIVGTIIDSMLGRTLKSA